MRSMAGEFKSGDLIYFRLNNEKILGDKYVSNLKLSIF